MLANVVYPHLPAVDQRSAVVTLLLGALLTTGPRDVKLAQQVATIAAAVNHPLLHGARAMMHNKLAQTTTGMDVVLAPPAPPTPAKRRGAKAKPAPAAPATAPSFNAAVVAWLSTALAARPALDATVDLLTSVNTHPAASLVLLAIAQAAPSIAPSAALLHALAGYAQHLADAPSAGMTVDAPLLAVLEGTTSTDLPLAAWTRACHAVLTRCAAHGTDGMSEVGWCGGVVVWWCGHAQLLSQPAWIAVPR